MSTNAEMRDVAEAGLNGAAVSWELYGRLTSAVGSRSASVGGGLSVRGAGL